MVGAAVVGVVAGTGIACIEVSCERRRTWRAICWVLAEVALLVVVVDKRVELSPSSLSVPLESLGESIVLVGK